MKPDVVMRLLFPILLVFCLVAGPLPSLAEQPRKVLLVVSGFGLDGGQLRPGYEFDELSQAYLVFRNSGFDVEIASPRGGEVVADDYDADKPYNAQFLADGMATARLASTRPLEAVKASEFAGIFIVGGKGAMFDLPYDPVLKALLVDHYEAGGVLGAVCHGPVAFTGLTNASGARLINNQPVTAFTNEETKLFGEKWVPHFPFVLEDELVATGARFAEAEPMMPFVQVGDRIVTGQNPNSTALAAEAMVRLLGVEPAARDLWADERSLMLVGRLLEGETGAAEQLAAEPELYDMPLIAMYGYYRTLDKTADAKALAQGLAVMELAAPYFDHPQLLQAIGDLRARLAQPAPSF